MEIKEIAPGSFSKRLLDAKPAPSKLYYSGSIPNPKLKNLVVIGSRKHSSYGKQVLKDLIAGLAVYPINIVSGLALGMDTLAHEEAMNHGMMTTAFPGSGIEYGSVHPQSNVKLVEKIIRNNCCIVSEFEPNFKATQYSFPQRNRLLAAYADAVLIIEAEEKSGTLITARLALEYGRDVLVVPGSIYSESSRGTNNLIKQGAIPVLKTNDIIENLGFEIKNSSERNDLSTEEKVILDILREPMTRDEIIRECDGTIEEINSLLMKMELREIIKEDAGYFRKI